MSIYKLQYPAACGGGPLFGPDLRNSHLGPRHDTRRSRGRTHVSTRPRATPLSKISLAPKGASTHVAKFENGRGVGRAGPPFMTAIRGEPRLETVLIRPFLGSLANFATGPHIEHWRAPPSLHP